MSIYGDWHLDRLAIDDTSYVKYICFTSEAHIDEVYVVSSAYRLKRVARWLQSIMQGQYR